MLPRLSYARGVDREVRRELRYYANIHFSLMKRFQTALDEAFDRIRQFPLAGSPHVHNTRIVLLKKFPYYIVYRLDGADVLIVAIAGSSRKVGYWRRRLP